ncbi:MAG: hypothetical protein ACYDDI_13700 [Candidatus Acidiferrales bacterium]
MNNDWQPTEKYPPLTDDKLSLIASALRDVRNQTLTLYDPLGGDDVWCHGCRVFSRSLFKVTEMSKQYPWLRVIGEEQKRRFTFSIDGIPMRFYRGSPDDPPPNYMAVTYGELLQRELFKDLIPLDKILRIAIETNAEGRVSTAKLVELNDAGKPTNVYLIPFDAAASNVVPLAKKPVDVGPQTVEPIPAEEEQKKRKRQKGERTS